ncbi:MAG: anti-sigma factor antagonist [Phycisphaerales bacterium]|nr:MAG: anti-sigma factor antagonist [Phycisphaerales bacterium]
MAIEWDEQIVIAELSDEPALSDELGTLGDRLSAIADDDRVPHVVISFGNVSYINSSNIAQLLRVRKRVSQAHKAMRLASVSEDVWSVMVVTGLDRVFTFAPDTMTAIAGLQLEMENAGEGADE